MKFLAFSFFLSLIRDKKLFKIEIKKLPKTREEN